MYESIFDTTRLSECRKHLGLTKQQAAAKLGMAQPTYLRYENGDRMPSEHVIRTIAEGFDTSVEYLTGKSDDPLPNYYVIKKETDEDLFLFIEKCKSDSAFMGRMLAYAEKISNSKCVRPSVCLQTQIRKSTELEVKSEVQ